jgi:nucleotide-binding universal stress UspA family protein
VSDKRIVVGVDGSEPSVQALRWAVRLAELTGAAVEAVTAWDLPQFYGVGGWTPPLEDLYPDDLARTVLDEAIAKAFGADAQPPVEIGKRVEQGSPARVLIDASASASLLAVGNRGHSALTEAALGSVSLACVHHAACPVTIVHGDIVL